jgi:endonuclease/exonuclease/phosphatase family metal-dependent hydrolase
MKMMFLLILSLLSSLAYTSERIEVVSFNTGFAKAKIFNLVACTKPRTKMFEEVLNKRITDNPTKTIYLFQELFTKRGFKALRRLGKKHNYRMYPDDFSLAKKSGIVTFTNLEVMSSQWIPFNSSKYPGIRRGVQIISIKDSLGKVVDIMNTHTAYSGKKAPDKTHISQLNQLKEEIQSRQKRSRSIILAGDFNIGDDYFITGQQYDQVETIWVPFIRALNNENIFEAKQPNPTWDQENNPLVFNPSYFVRNFVTRDGKWEEQTSTIDHIFTSMDIIMNNTGILFNTPIDSNKQCRGDDTYLSDHYGVISTLVFENFSQFKTL